MSSGDKMIPFLASEMALRLGYFYPSLHLSNLFYSHKTKTETLNLFVVIRPKPKSVLLLNLTDCTLSSSKCQTVKMSK